MSASFADDILIFLYKGSILIQISTDIFRNGPDDNNPALVH